MSNNQNVFNNHRCQDNDLNYENTTALTRDQALFFWSRVAGECECAKVGGRARGGKKREPDIII